MIDFTKPVQTRDGEPWRKYADDGGGTRPIHGAYLFMGAWVVGSWLEDGKFDEEGTHGLDLINVPEEHEITVSVYKYNSGKYAVMDTCCAAALVARVHVKFKEGDGL